MTSLVPLTLETRLILFMASVEIDVSHLTGRLSPIKFRKLVTAHIIDRITNYPLQY